MQTTGSNVVQAGNLDADNYLRWVEELNNTFLLYADGPIFETNIDGDRIWELYLEGFTDPVQRQYHNCSACRTFFKRYGGLAVVGESGVLQPLLWTQFILDRTLKLVPELYSSISKIAGAVGKAQISNVFLSSEGVYGQAQTGIWRHIHIKPKKVFKATKLKTAFQAAAEKKEEFGTVARFLSEYELDHLAQVYEIAKSDSLYRNEKIFGQAEWLFTLKTEIESTKNSLSKRNIIWKAVATAPAGFCHPRSSMINTLLEDLEQGYGIELAAKRFADKMNPIKYQRPQAAPTAGNIQRAEKIVADLGIQESLKRRFATEEDILAWVWRPESRSVKQQTASVFGDLVPKGEVKEPTSRGLKETMTWTKFRDKLLPSVTRIQLHVPGSYRMFTTFVTAEDPNAPPILQWDHENNRNPVSWYVWHRGSPASQFGLRPGSLVDVTGITLKPPYWNNPEHMVEHQGEGLVFVLEGAVDTLNSGNGLFPEILKESLREVKATIEAYSRKQKVLPAPEGTKPVAGLALFKNSKDGPIQLEVTLKTGIVSTIIIDRWD